MEVDNDNRDLECNVPMGIKQGDSEKIESREPIRKVEVGSKQ